MADYEIDLIASTTEVVEVETTGYEVNLDADVDTAVEVDVSTPPAEINLDVGSLDYSINLEYGYQGETHTHFPSSKVLTYTSGQLTQVDSATATLVLTYDVSGNLDTVSSADWTKTMAYNPDGSLASVTVS